MNRYETAFVLNSDLSENQVVEAFEKYWNCLKVLEHKFFLFM